jgi:hypothetical protein
MRPSTLGVCALVLFLLPGCGGSHESVVREGIAILKEAADTLETVKDARTAEAARPALKKLGERWRANQKRASAMKPPSKHERVHLQRQYLGEFEAAYKRYLLEVHRVRRLPKGDETVDELQPDSIEMPLGIGKK